MGLFFGAWVGGIGRGKAVLERCVNMGHGSSLRWHASDYQQKAPYEP